MFLFPAACDDLLTVNNNDEAVPSRMAVKETGDDIEHASNVALANQGKRLSYSTFFKTTISY